MYDGNPAGISGVMHEIYQYIKHTGNFQLLFEQRAVPLFNGGMAIDQAENISFIEKQLPNSGPYMSTAAPLGHTPYLAGGQRVRGAAPGDFFLILRPF